MCSDKGCRWFATAGFPIRISPDRRLYTASRGFSQCPTSLFGIWRLGIHHKPSLAYLPSTESSIVFALSSCPFSFSFSYAPSSHRLSAMLYASLACDASLIRFLRCGRSLCFTEAYASFFWFPSCGDDGTRTRDIRLAKAALSQLSYIPECLYHVFLRHVLG